MTRDMGLGLPSSPALLTVGAALVLAQRPQAGRS